METHLASMENITCWAFRKLCHGASDSYTGMLSLTNLIKRNNTWEEVDTFLIKGQRQWIQVATSKETECSAFLKRLEEEVKKHPEKNHIYGIQLNCSCPSPNLIKIGQGAALIKRPGKVRSLIEELLNGKYNVGVKLRLGLNENEVKDKKIFNLLKELEKIKDPKFINVTIHLKHAQKFSSDDYDYSIIDELVSYHLPFIINGGIKNSNDIEKIMENISIENKENIKGIMMGREALKDPNCFLKINENFKDRNLKKELNENYEQHRPKEIYIKSIKEKCII